MTQRRRDTGRASGATAAAAVWDDGFAAELHGVVGSLRGVARFMPRLRERTLVTAPPPRLLPLCTRAPAHPPPPFATEAASSARATSAQSETWRTLFPH